MTEVEKTILDFGQAVRERRRTLGMTQAELGALAECSDLFVRELEKGKPTVRLETVLRVMNAIGLTLNVGDVK